MKSIGIVSEFNPFHDGHQHLIRRAKEITGAEVVVSVMSGNFTQRGMPAVYDKWERAEEAVRSGVDLIAELPAVYACNSAEYFAKGAVSVLEGFGCIDTLAFGSESGDLDELKQAADFLKCHKSEITERITGLTRQGLSYPKARQQTACEIRPEINSDVFSLPNNILALEYLQQIHDMAPLTIPRTSGYHESSTRLRAELEIAFPERFREMEDQFFRLAAARILQSDTETLERIFLAGQGLAQKLKNEIRYCSNLDELVQRVKSKVYTRTRVTRLLCQVVLSIDREAVLGACPYIRILGMSEAGSAFLRHIKKTECARIPVITNINKELQNHPEVVSTLSFDILASDMYNLINHMDLYRHSDYVRTPFLLNKERSY